ncbi:thioester reductase domain-containing protein [Williamsia sp. CHRR-6]|uniref:thioester reductase domain-containing protein n=1 Tax=Williamsia sp. CHRR-6 TaxID=2835871 RepID=UPI001BD93468|nr:thioester reductase domain-containing protein [Williamsia sp. CHRR-6]MBT0566972.1 thioester reductase domain-containing protein [Williamsia sp. CHRR-6]
MPEIGHSDAAMILRVRDVLTEIVVGYLQIPAEKIDPAAPFADYGLDSVYALSVAADVEDRLGIALDPTLMWDYPTLDSLSAAIAGLMAEPEAASTEAEVSRGITATELSAEAFLPDDIRRPDGQPISAPDNVFLTGATGFAGAYLIAELIARTEYTVYTLVRARDEGEARDRVRLNLTTYGLWNDATAARVKAIPGDLGRDQLGLTEVMFKQLADTIDVIIHNGAAVNFALPYRRLRAANVGGTVEILRMAAQGKATSVNMISSMGVMPERPGTQSVPEAAMTDPTDVVGGYRQTKWVAERLVVEAGRRGVPTKIFRPGNVTGSQQTAVGAQDTIINALIKGCVQLGAAFEFDVVLLLVPVDFLASTVVTHIIDGNHDNGFVNLPGASRLLWSELIDLVAGAGYHVPMLPYSQWHELFSARGASTALAPYAPLLTPDGPAPELGVNGNRPEIETTATDTAVTGPRCAPMDAALWNRYLEHLVEVGYLESPKSGLTLSGVSV